MNEVIAGLLSIGVFFAGAILYEVRSMRKDLTEFAQRLANLEGRVHHYHLRKGDNEQHY